MYHVINISLLFIYLQILYKKFKTKSKIFECYIIKWGKIIAAFYFILFIFFILSEKKIRFFILLYLT